MSRIRIIAGTARGRRLNLVPGRNTRPISDRAKEALFNIIGADIRECYFLDLFGGTGSVGLEALSRGAEHAVLVDRSDRAIKTMESNLVLTGFTDKAEIRRCDALAYLERKPGCRFDYIYIAPPQHKGLWSDTLRCLDDNAAWINNDGWTIAQIHPSEFHELDMVHLDLFDQRRYGNTMFCFYSGSEGVK